MAVKTYQDQFEDWFADVEYAAQDCPIPNPEEAKTWAHAGFMACLRLFMEEGVETRMEDAMRELKLLSDRHPTVFRKVAERLEKTL